MTTTDSFACENGRRDGWGWALTCVADLDQRGLDLATYDWPLGPRAGVLGPNEALINAVGKQELAFLLGITMEEIGARDDAWSRALEAYDAGWYEGVREAIDEILRLASWDSARECARCEEAGRAWMQMILREQHAAQPSLVLETLRDGLDVPAVQIVERTVGDWTYLRLSCDEQQLLVDAVLRGVWDARHAARIP